MQCLCGFQRFSTLSTLSLYTCNKLNKKNQKRTIGKVFWVLVYFSTCTLTFFALYGEVRRESESEKRNTKKVLPLAGGGVCRPQKYLVRG